MGMWVSLPALPLLGLISLMAEKSWTTPLSAVFASSVLAAHAEAMAVHVYDIAMPKDIGGLVFHPRNLPFWQRYQLSLWHCGHFGRSKWTQPRVSLHSSQEPGYCCGHLFHPEEWGQSGYRLVGSRHCWATIGANSVVEGSMLAWTAIIFGTQSKLHGYALAQSAVTFESEGYTDLHPGIAQTGSASHLRGFKMRYNHDDNWMNWIKDSAWYLNENECNRRPVFYNETSWKLYIIAPCIHIGYVMVKIL